MPITPRLNEKLAAVLGEPLECLGCGSPIEPECPSSLRCSACWNAWAAKRHPERILKQEEENK